MEIKLIIGIVVVILVLAYIMSLEGYCACTGLQARPSSLIRPTYFVYRPEGDVSLYPLQNLGWKTSMPYDTSLMNSSGNYFKGGRCDMNLVQYSLPPCKMLSDGSPSYKGPAGSFQDIVSSPGMVNGKGCPSRSAYDLGVGVL